MSSVSAVSDARRPVHFWVSRRIMMNFDHSKTPTTSLPKPCALSFLDMNLIFHAQASGSKKISPASEGRILLKDVQAELKQDPPKTP